MKTTQTSLKVTLPVMAALNALHRGASLKLKISHCFLPQRFSLAMTIFALLAGPSAFVAQGQTSTWTGLGNDSTSTTGWADNNNWSPVGSPAGNALVFPAGITGANLTNGDDISGVLSITGLTFSSGAGAYVLGVTLGNSVTTSGALVDNSTTAETIGFPIALNGSQAISVTGGGSLTINGIISGTGFAVTNTGAGTNTLAAANTFDSGLYINSGTVIGTNSATALGATSVTLGSAGGGTAMLLGGATNGTQITFANPITVVSNNGTATLGNIYGSDTYFTGGLTLNGPLTVIDSGANILGSTAAGQVDLGAITGTNQITIVSVPCGTLNTIDNYGMVNLTVATPGFTGPYYITTNSTFRPASFSNTNNVIYIDAGGELDCVNNGNQNAAGLMNGTNGGGFVGFDNEATSSRTLNLGGGGNYSFSGVLRNAPTSGSVLSLNVDLHGGGLQTLSGASIFTGTTTVTAGTLVIGGSGQFLGTSGTYGGAVSVSSGATLNDSSSANQTWSGVFSGTGTLVQNGSGSLTLSGANTFKGITTINAGTLGISASSIGWTNTITVNDGGTLNVIASSTNLPPASLTLGSVSGATLAFSSVASTTTAPLKATTLTLNGVNTININSGTLALGGSYPLIIYTNALGAGSYVLGTIAGFSGYLSSASASGATTISLNITGIKQDTWTAANNSTWDFTTANWTNTVPTNIFANGDFVTFNDTASAFTVNLATNVSPGSMTFSNSAHNYTINSAGGFTLGGSAVTLAGTNTTVTLNTTNTFAGPITIGGSNEVLVIGGTGKLGGGNYGGSIINNGTLSYNSTANQTLSGVISGSGGITDNSTNTLTLSVANSFTGNIVITNGGTLLDSFGGGANGTATTGLGNPLISGRTVTINTNATLIFSANGNLGGGSSITLLSYIVNGGSIQATGAGNNDTIGPITLNGGSLIVTAQGYSDSFGPIAFSGDITVGGSSPSFISSSNPNNCVNLVVANAVPNRTFTVANVTGDATYTNVDLYVSAPLGDSSSTSANNNSAPAGLTKAGTGTMLLNGTNMYSGGTIISAGTLIAGIADDLPTTAGSHAYAGGTGNPGGAANTAGALGLPQTIITLGDTNTTASNSSPTLIVGGAFTVDHPIVVSTNPTTGTYTIGGSTDTNSIFTSLVTLNQPLKVTQVTNTVGNELTFNGGFTSGSGLQTVTFAGPGNVVVATTGISDGSGQVAVNVSGGTLYLNVANTYTGNTTIAGGATLDESALGSYSLQGAFTVGGAVPSTNNGALNIPSGPGVILNYTNTSIPALVASGGALTFNGNSFAVNGPVLANGSYTVITVANGGSLANNSASAVLGTAIGVGHSAVINFTATTAKLVVSTAAAPRTPTTTAINSSLNPSFYGNPVSLTATVTPTPVDGEPITFSNGVTFLGTAIITGGGGAATLTVSSLPYSPLSNNITAYYPGDSVYSNSVGTLSGGQVVQQATLTYAANPTNQAYGQPNHIFSGTVTGFANSDGPSNVLTGTAVFSSTTTASSSAGIYAINGSGVTVTNSNYSSTIVQAPGNATALTINPIPHIGVALQDGSTAITYSGTATVSQSVTVTPGASVLVVLVEDHVAFNGEPATLDWLGGQTLTLAVNQSYNDPNDRGIAIYYLYNPTPGTSTISVTVAGADTTWMSAYTLNGVNTSIPPLSGSVPDDNAGATVSFNVAGVTAGAWAAVNSVFLGNPQIPTITGTGGTNYQSYDAEGGPNTTVTAGYLAALSAGLDTFSCNWGVVNKGDFEALVFTPNTSAITISNAIASPNPATTGQSVLLQITTTSSAGSISTVSVDASSVGGSSTLALHLSATPNVWTNSTVVTASSFPTNELLPYVVGDSANNYVAGNIPLTINSPITISNAIASPNPVITGKPVQLSVTATSSAGSVTNVTVDASSVGGSSTLALHLSATPNVWTNSTVVTAGSFPTTASLPFTVLDNANNSLAGSIPLTILGPVDVWNGGAAPDNTWANGLNWVGGSAPGTGSQLFFAGTTQTNVNMESAYTVSSLTFSNNAGSFSITNSANTLTLATNATVANNSANLETLGVPVLLNGPVTLNAASGNLLLTQPLNEAVAGAGTLTNTGTGNTILEGENTYTGNTTISSGTLTIGTGGDLGDLGPGAGGTYGGNITNNGTLNLFGGVAQTLSGVISGPGALNFAGGGNSAPVYVLTGANPFTGNITISNTYVSDRYQNNSMTITASGLGNPQTVGQTITINSNAVLSFDNSNPLGNGSTVEQGSFIINQGGILQVTTVGGVENVTVPLIVLNGGTLQTVGTVGFNLQYAALELNFGVTAGGPTAGPSLIQSIGGPGPSTLINLGVNQPTGYQSPFIVNTAGVNPTGAPDLTVEMGMTNSSDTEADTGISKSGTGVLALTSQQNTFTGPIAVNNGTFLLADPGQLGTGGTYAANILNNSVFISTTTSGQTLSGVVSGTGNLIVETNQSTTAGLNAILTMTGGNTYTGATVVGPGGDLVLQGSINNSALIDVQTNGTLDVTGLAGFTVNPGQTLLGSGTVLQNSSIILTNNGILSAGEANAMGTLTLSGPLTLTGTSTTALRINKTGSVLTNDVVAGISTATYSGTLAVTKTGTGTLALGDSFTLFGATGGTGNFSSIVSNPGGYGFTFNPNTGVLTVTSTVNTNAATAHFAAVKVGGTLQFSWAADHEGWQLYTNSVGLNTANWFPVAGSASVTNETININPAQPKVFFQLRYP